ncbi:Response regulator receiver domain-containing protein [Ensifer adhaerens]|nr:Response regulator receiver domain-containing protein [Ensifer adhaerens]
MATVTRNVKFDYVESDALLILAVDDDPIQREFCSVYMTTPTVTVETADCAEAGLERLEAQDYGALLVDVDMPGMSGIELVALLRSQPRFDRMPIMVITGNEDIPSIDAAYAAGATAFMCKPVNWRLLSHQVRFMVRAHHALMALGDDVVAASAAQNASTAQ